MEIVNDRANLITWKAGVELGQSASVRSCYALPRSFNHAKVANAIMTSLIFICSGNTCRSPMAEGHARTIFGPSHSVASAGAETVGGRQAAKHAVAAMKELGIDISNHKTTQLDISTLEAFDTIIVFTPSVAESVPISNVANTEYFEIDDPYGADLEKYRKTARRIRSAVRELYAKDAMRRLISSDAPKGSHLEGMYCRAASEFEKELHTFVMEFVDPNVHPKATLGNLATSLQNSKHDGHKVLASLVEIANDPWVDYKHKEDPDPLKLLDGLKAMIEAYSYILSDQTKPSLAGD